MTSPDCPGLLQPSATKVLHWANSTHLPDGEQIHKLRVAVKKLRAGLALMQPWFNTQPLKLALREFNRYLSPSRDLAVACQWLDYFIANRPGEQKIACFVPLRQLLTPPSSTVLDLAEFHRRAQRLQQALQQLPRYHPKLNQWRTQVELTAQQLCQQAPMLYHRYKRSEDCIYLHRWRKRVKQLDYQQRLLSTFDVQSALSPAKLKKLGELLGEVQDLWMLEQQLLLRLKDCHPSPTRAEVKFTRQFLLWQREKRLAQALAVHEALLA